MSGSEDLDILELGVGNGNIAKEKPQVVLQRIDERYPFKTFCSMLEAVIGKSTSTDRLGVLEAFWKSTAAAVRKRFGNDALVDQYPFMRLLIPHLDSMRLTYGLKESKIALYYTQILQIPADSTDAQRLVRWKDPSKSNFATTHFSDVVYTVLVKRGHGENKQSLTVCDINTMLDNLSLAASPDKKKTVLMTLLRSTNALEQKWLIRILVKDMRMHIQHTTILGKFHPTALQLYNTTTDLKHVCEKCVDPSFLPKDHRGLVLFKPFSPMLASLITKEKLEMLLSTEKLTVEPKYDGERMLLHYQKLPTGEHRTMFWTRNTKDYTDVYGPKFEQPIKDCMKCDNCILDGEFLVYDNTLKGFKAFGTNKTFALGNSTNDEQFCFMAFDVILLNGEVLTEYTLDQRRARLTQAFKPIKNVCEAVPFKRVSTTKDVFRALDEAVANSYEGVVLKNNASSYRVGERKLKWLKLKRDHIDGLADTMDLVILGGYYGTKFGKRHVSHFLLGVYDEETNEWSTFTKVGTGYTEVELEVLLKRLEPHWMKYDKTAPPSHLGGWTPAADDLPDLWIDPQKSVVLEIIGYAFNDTVKFKVGRTVRFPRVRHIRSDKSVEDAMTLAKLRELMDMSFKSRKLAEDLGDDYMLTRQVKKPPKKTGVSLATNLPVNYTVRSRELPDELCGVSTFLKPNGVPLKLCILQADTQWTKPVLESLIVSHGGEVIANPGANTYQLAASASSAKVKHWEEAIERNDTRAEKYGNKYVLHYSWLLDSIKARRPIPCAPRYMVYTSPDIRETFSRTMDKYGDSYTAECTVDSLREVLKQVKHDESKGTLMERSSRVAGLKRGLGLEGGMVFSGVTLGFPTEPQDGSCEVAMYEALHEDATVLPSEESGTMPTYYISSVPSKRPRTTLGPSWVTDSIHAGTMLPISSYQNVLSQATTVTTTTAAATNRQPSYTFSSPSSDSSDTCVLDSLDDILQPLS
eukprot:TRINITY_DN4833_c0_g1_i1.p1 TRINITY_DN4833_c0_g1~~TRINITY_DN4833_c0_g1_i1.p1  ORF type:complete len:974 (+),score=264.38 TRINITY_DN4833_c0_g1_i1:1957-4878(+)